MKRIQLILSLLIFVNVFVIAQNRADKNFIVHEELIFPYQSEHVHGSSIVLLPNGDMLAAWFQGSGHSRQGKRNMLITNAI